MKAPETAIDVKMHEFGRLVDDLLDASHECEIAEDRHSGSARAKYKQAREQLMGAIRGAVGACFEPPSTVRCSWCGGDLLNRNQAATSIPSQNGVTP